MTTVKVEVETFLTIFTVIFILHGLSSPQLRSFIQDYKNDANTLNLENCIECKTNKKCQLYGQIDKQEVKREKHVRIEG